MIREASGNLLAAEAEALVNTVNTVGVMGKGIALQFRRHTRRCTPPTSVRRRQARFSSVT